MRALLRVSMAIWIYVIFLSFRTSGRRFLTVFSLPFQDTATSSVAFLMYGFRNLDQLFYLIDVSMFKLDASDVTIA